MEPHFATSGFGEPASHHTPEHHHGMPSIDGSYRLVVRTVLWVIVGLVFLGFAIWWVLT